MPCTTRRCYLDMSGVFSPFRLAESVKAHKLCSISKTIDRSSSSSAREQGLSARAIGVISRLIASIATGFFEICEAWRQCREAADSWNSYNPLGLELVMTISYRGELPEGSDLSSRNRWQFRKGPLQMRTTGLKTFLQYHSTLRAT